MPTNNATSTSIHTNTKTLSVLVIGATGTAGQATVSALLDEGHNVTCLIRQKTTLAGASPQSANFQLPDTVKIHYGDVTTTSSTIQASFGTNRFDVLVSCLASRTGVKSDAWAIDYQAQSNVLQAAIALGIEHMVLLSAICVQKPLLAFQHAKLAFEKEVINSGISYSIVRPTAFFKSLSGQVKRVERGKPYLIFGDGKLTACKPISDSDLGAYMARCITDSTLHNKILPIGGPGGAITPYQQGEWLFEMTGQTPRFRSVPVVMFNVAAVILSFLARINKRFEPKAELAKIGRYYATESMLLLDQKTNQYDAENTPSTGTDTLKDFYKALLDGTQTVSQADHAVFDKNQSDQA